MKSEPRLIIPISMYKVNALSEDVCSLSRNSKENIDVLKDLEKRVQHLRSINTTGSSSRPWADRQVRQALSPC